MAELSGAAHHPGRRVLRLLPILAGASAVIGLFDHPLAHVAAWVAIGAVVLTTVLRLAMEARTWRLPADRGYLLAIAGLVLVIVAGALLGRGG